MVHGFRIVNIYLRLLSLQHLFYLECYYFYVCKLSFGLYTQNLANLLVCLTHLLSQQEERFLHNV